MDKQLIFNNTLEHLRHQGHAAMTNQYPGDNRCVYLARNGDRCAVGIHLGTKDIDMIEGMGVGQAFGHHPELFEHLHIEGANDIAFLSQLQYAHDQYLGQAEGTDEYYPKLPYQQGIEAWEAQMQKTAHVFGLVYTPPGQGSEAAKKVVTEVLDSLPALAEDAIAYTD